jgi:hypothetical protein
MSAPRFEPSQTLPPTSPTPLTTISVSLDQDNTLKIKILQNKTFFENSLTDALNPICNAGFNIKLFVIVVTNAFLLQRLLDVLAVSH